MKPTKIEKMFFGGSGYSTFNFGQNACEGGCGRVEIKLTRAAPGFLSAWSKSRLCTLCASTPFLGEPKNFRTNTICFDMRVAAADDDAPDMVVPSGTQLFRGRLELSERRVLRNLKKTNPSLHNTLKRLKMHNQRARTALRKTRLQKNARTRTQDSLRVNTRLLESDVGEGEEVGEEDEEDVYYDEGGGGGFTDEALFEGDGEVNVQNNNSSSSLVDEDDEEEEVDVKKDVPGEAECAQLLLSSIFSTSESPVYFSGAVEEADNIFSSSGVVVPHSFVSSCDMCGSSCVQSPCARCERFILNKQ